MTEPSAAGAKTVKSTNITRVTHRVTVTDRWVRNGHQSGILWFTGLSGAGKTTLALELERQLHADGHQAYVLDGDNLRGGLNGDLGFSPEDRSENIRRAGEVAALFADAGVIVIGALISPYEADRQMVRAMRPDLFHEVFIKSDLDVCESRDPKGLYKKARAGEIPEFTGISAPYEEPVAPELIVDTANQTVDQSIKALRDYISANLFQDRAVEVA